MEMLEPQVLHPTFFILVDIVSTNISHLFFKNWKKSQRGEASVIEVLYRTLISLTLHAI